MSPLIIIDPGHYDNYNQGVCQGYYEGAVMLQLGHYLASELSKRGAEVYMTRTSLNDNPSLEDRGALAANADLFISLHSDAAADPANLAASGVTVYYSIHRPESKALADQIGSGVSRAMSNQFLGSETRLYPNTDDKDYYAVIRSAVDAGAQNAYLVEHGFHTNPKDCAVLMDDAKLMQIAKNEAKAIGDYFGLSLRPKGTYIVKEGDNLYNLGIRFGVPWQSIAALNGIDSRHLIYPSQELVIPAE